MLPDNPVIFQEDSFEDDKKQVQWAAFVKKSRLAKTSPDFKEVMKRISASLKPVIEHIKRKTNRNIRWVSPSGSWH